MAIPKKTNIKINNKNYFRITVSIGYDTSGERICKTFMAKEKRMQRKGVMNISQVL